jgi:hypothetical protein
MNLLTEPYLDQQARWPQSGRHILAQYDAESIVVYQAYNASVGNFASNRGYFGGSHFSLDRMSWIKPNFLWMMYRCGWASKPNQEVVLAVRLRRSAFDTLLQQAVPSSYVRELYPTYEAWQAAVQGSNVRVQWDPDHDPAGNKLERRAIQLGLRGPALASYAREWIISIEDVTEFVREQAQHIHNPAALITPREDVYPV